MQESLCDRSCHRDYHQGMGDIYKSTQCVGIWVLLEQGNGIRERGQTRTFLHIL